MLFNILLFASTVTTATNAFHVPHHHYISTTTTTTTTITSAAIASTTITSTTTTQETINPQPSIYSPIPLYDPANRYKVFICLAPEWANCTKFPSSPDPGMAGQCYNIQGNITGFDPYPEQLCRIYDVEECAATADEGTWNSFDVWFPGFDDVNSLEWEEGKALKGLRSWRCVEPGKEPIP